MYRHSGYSKEKNNVLWQGLNRTWSLFEYYVHWKLKDLFVGQTVTPEGTSILYWIVL